MSKLPVVTTNNVPRPLVCFYDLPEKERRDFDYVKEEERGDNRFVRFKDAWYDVNDVQEIHCRKEHDRPMGWALYVEPDHPFAKWNAIVSETYFSGVLIRYVMDEEAVIMGSYYS